jgi:hypothetical protein
LARIKYMYIVIEQEIYCFNFHPISQEWPKRADKASLLTASRMLFHAFPSIFVNSLREFPENCVYNLNYFKQNSSLSQGKILAILCTSIW